MLSKCAKISVLHKAVIIMMQKSMKTRDKNYVWKLNEIEQKAHMLTQCNNNILIFKYPTGLLWEVLYNVQHAVIIGLYAFKVAF